MDPLDPPDNTEIVRTMQLAFTHKGWDEIEQISNFLGLPNPPDLVEFAVVFLRILKESAGDKTDEVIVTNRRGSIQTRFSFQMITEHFVHEGESEQSAALSDLLANTNPPSRLN